MKYQVRSAVLLIASLAGTQVPAQSQDSVSVPSKIDISPVSTQNRVGAAVPVQVQLQDRNGRPVASQGKVAAEVKVEQPSGQTKTYSVIFTPGESTKQIDIPIDEGGLAKLTVKQKHQELIGASNYVLVRPAKEQFRRKLSEPRVTPKPAKKPQQPGQQGPGAELRDFDRARPFRAKLIYAADPLPQVPAPEQASAAQLVLTVSGEDVYGGTRADGQTCARVQVFYMGSSDLQRNVQVWLSPSNGDVNPNPIVIQKGSTLGSACWTSKYPIPAAVLTASSNPPNFEFVSAADEGKPRQVTHKFTDNITGIEFVNPPTSITIVDSFTLATRFTGPNGPTSVSDKRELQFTTDSAVLKANPLQTFVDAGGFEASTTLTPTFFGKSTVQVSTPLYPPATLKITITWLGVLIASLLGGLLGGLVAWINSQGKLWMRIVVGVIVGLVASWAYVMVGLPKVETAFLHSRISVFFVALLVGVSGVKGLTFIATKLELPTL